MQYFCKNQARRLKVASSNSINGMDYLEVVSSDQKNLVVHFFHPLPGETGGVPMGINFLSADNFIIEGGSRIQNIEVVAVTSDSDIMRIQVNMAGDFSTYTLRLVSSPSNKTTLEGFDSQLSSIPFSFKANCPSDFDCKIESICPEEPISDPRVDYLAKDYSSFRRLLLDRLSLLMPEWRERNVADLKIALVELMAYTGDYLSYYQDAVATESYLFKARKRTSSIRHARLLDYHVHNGCNARTWIAIEVESGSSSDMATLPESTLFLTKGISKESRINSTDLDRKLKEKNIIPFESRHELTIYHFHNEIHFYTWDDTNCCLPKGATKATLYREDQNSLFLETGQVLIFEEINSPTTGREADADYSHRHAIRLTQVLEREDFLNEITVYDIAWAEEDALPFPLCISATIDGILFSNLSVARGNIVLADHGLSKEVKQLEDMGLFSVGKFRPKLPDIGVTVALKYHHQAAKKLSAKKTLLQNPHEAVPQITLTTDREIWQSKRSLLGSDRFATEFVAEIEADLSVQMRFGDNILGKNPGLGFQPKANYRIGNGLAGNIGAEGVGRMVWDQDGILNVRNPLPSEGGKRPESMEEVRQYAPEAFRTQERAVTEEDYKEKTELHPEVQKALAKFRWTGSWLTVFLTIDRKNDLPIDQSFRSEIYTHLEKYRMAGYDLEIRPPVFVPLEMEINVCVKPGYFRSSVKEKLLQVFSRYELVNGVRGFFHPDEFSFGQPVYLSAVYHKAMSIDGVASVEMTTFKKQNRSSDLEKENGVIKASRNEIIRLDNDPNFPENGKIDFLMFGGL
ncbi:MAG TPA: hypothetical protein VK957_18110 [Lunatimonas sp.]|nr:hypothetical protein [Lunatimonas sp.]